MLRIIRDIATLLIDCCVFGKIPTKDKFYPTNYTFLTIVLAKFYNENSQNVLKHRVFNNLKTLKSADLYLAPGFFSTNNVKSC